MTEDTSPVRRIAEAVRPGLSIERVDPVDTGNRRRTATVRFRDAEPIVIQIGADPEAAKVEAHLLDALTDRTSVPVPTPLGSGTIDDTGWVATPLVSGADLHRVFTDLDHEGRRLIARSFGKYLAEIHDAFRFDAYGPVTVVDGELVVDDACALPDPATDDPDGETGDRNRGGSADDRDADSTGAEWRSWLTAFGRVGLARLPSEFDTVRAGLADVLDGFDPEPAPVPRLFPWDFRPGNALIADGHVAAVLDWEAPLAASPALSVAKTEYLVADWYVRADEADGLREAFREGYESVRAYPRVRSAHRVAAVVSAAVDSRGAVTAPGYPPVSRADAVLFHLRTLEALV